MDRLISPSPIYWFSVYLLSDMKTLVVVFTEHIAEKDVCVIRNFHIPSEFNLSGL